VALPAAWYGASFLAHEWGCVGMAIIANERKLKISFPQLSGHAKPGIHDPFATLTEPVSMAPAIGFMKPRAGFAF